MYEQHLDTFFAISCAANIILIIALSITRSILKDTKADKDKLKDAGARCVSRNKKLRASLKHAYQELNELPEKSKFTGKFMKRETRYDLDALRPIDYQEKGAL